MFIMNKNQHFLIIVNMVFHHCLKSTCDCLTTNCYSLLRCFHTDSHCMVMIQPVWRGIAANIFIGSEKKFINQVKHHFGLIVNQSKVIPFLTVSISGPLDEGVQQGLSSTVIYIEGTNLGHFSCCVQVYWLVWGEWPPLQVIISMIWLFCTVLGLFVIYCCFICSIAEMIRVLKGHTDNITS